MVATKTDPQASAWNKLLPAMLTRYRDGKISFQPNEQDIELVKYMAKEMGLDPLKKHIVLLQHMAAYTTVDGLRQMANSRGILDGIDRSKYEFVDPNESGKSRYIVTVTAWKKDSSHPFTATADQAEYENTSSGTWKKSPLAMTTKCAEALCLRMMLDISIPTLEEMGYDEFGGMTAQEAKAEAQIETQTAAGEEKAVQAAASKSDAKAARDTEKASKISQEQFKQIGAIYKMLGLSRNGDNGSETLFRNTFPQYAGKHEQFLNTTEAKSYILKLWAMLLNRVKEKCGLDDKAMAAVLNKALPNAKNLNEVLDEEWPQLIAAAQWTGVVLLQKRLNWSTEKIDSSFVEEFPEAKQHSDISYAQLDAYIDKLTAQSTQASSEAAESAPGSDEEIHQASLLDPAAG